MKTIGRLYSFTGRELCNADHGIPLEQSKYVHRLLEAEKLFKFKPVNTPSQFNADLSKKNGRDLELSPADHRRYRSLTGAVLCSEICTNLEISFSISVLTRKLHALTNRQWFLAKRVVMCVPKTAYKPICYSTSTKCTSTLITYADSDLGGCKDKRRSTQEIMI